MKQKIIDTKTGAELTAIHLNEVFAENAKALAEMPQGFKKSNRVGGFPHDFYFRGVGGKLGQWFIFPEASAMVAGRFVDEAEFLERYAAKVEPAEDPKETEETAPTDFDKRVPPAVDFELELAALMQKHLATGLTVTEAVGTLNLIATDIQIQFLKNH